MNSAIQCMSNTTELNQYFLCESPAFIACLPSTGLQSYPLSTAGVFKDELNRENPLGMKGQVAEAFGTLVASLSSPSP